MADTKTKLSKVTVSLHWIVGLTIVALLAVGVYMEQNEAFALYPIHKSFGVIIFAFVIARVIWRIKNGWPEPASDYARHEQILSKIVHWVLIIGTILMPVSGMMLSGAGGYGVYIFSLEIIPTNFVNGEGVPYNETVAGIGYVLHGYIGNIMIGAIVLHILGALKHHIMDKDGTLKRMLGQQIS